MSLEDVAFARQEVGQLKESLEENRSESARNHEESKRLSADGERLRGEIHSLEVKVSVAFHTLVHLLY